MFKRMSTMVSKELRNRFVAAGQDHVFKFVDEGKLSPEETKQLIEQLESIDLDFVSSVYSKTMTTSGKEETGKITPVPSDKIARVDSPLEERESWTKLGLDAISKGEVAAVVLSGGQGSRLGFNGPKGMYDIELPSHKSLFQLHAERILALSNQCGSTIPWYIMTSPLNHDTTFSFFESHGYFGLDPQNVTFFPQGTLPCLTKEGKLILESKCKVANAPDGNGGIYSSMERTGVISDMKKRGIKYIHAYAIDNAMVQVADPAFVGYCIHEGADVGNKACPKAAWNEAVGVMALRDGKYEIVEYSEISEEMAKEKDPETGRLAFGAGNICNHWYTLDFLQNVAIPSLSNSYHVAHKKIPAADPTTGETVKPSSNNGIKLEMFIFDVFPFAQKMAILECDRASEFSPVKNAPGSPSDSPDTAREMMFKEHRKWLSEAGASVRGEGAVEVSPLVSVNGSGLKQIFSGMQLECPLLVCKAGENQALAKAEENGVSHALSDNGLHVYTISP